MVWLKALSWTKEHPGDTAQDSISVGTEVDGIQDRAVVFGNVLWAHKIEACMVQPHFHGGTEVGSKVGSELPSLVVERAVNFGVSAVLEHISLLLAT